jgi:anhydro-N-acetylmuramic acid kinase
VASPVFLGLISGTSADGIDAALMHFEPAPVLLAARTFPYPDELRARVLATMHADSMPIDAYGQLDVEIGEAFAAAALALLREAGVAPNQVVALGSHGQTVRHRPSLAHPFTLQIGDPNRIAERTGIVTVADFRRRDIAAGGQGAPLVCALHAELFAASGEARAILNLGGIANLTLLQPGQPVRGFDTGPANCLLDGWALRHLGRARDEGGALAASGQVCAALLDDLLSDDYFARDLPKSTGREHFHMVWLDQRLARHSQLAPADVQATLLELSVYSISGALARHAPDTQRVIACGGGVHNASLMTRLASVTPAQLGHPCALETTAAHGLDPDFVEAAAFAWLAQQTLAGLPGNCVEVTGARGPRVLGAVYSGILQER